MSLKLKGMFTKIHKGEIGTLHLSATDENSRDLEWFLSRYPMGMSDDDSTRLRNRARSFDKKVAASASILRGDYVRPTYSMALPPREYQRQDAALAENVRGLLIASELGLGKSVSALTLLANPQTLPAVIICPTHLPSQWQRETTRFLPALKTHIVKGTKPYDISQYDVIFLNYHKLSSWSATLSKHVNTVVYDEAQELRRSESDRYAAAVGLSQQVEYRLGCSATPIYNYGVEFYNVFNCLAPGMLGEKYEFLREWCHGYYDERKAKIHDTKAFGTYLREAGRMIRRTKAEVGRELPALTKIVEEVGADLSYLKRIESSATELAKFIIENSGVAKGFDMMKASQEFSNTMRQATGIAKAPFVSEFVSMMIEATGEKVVLFGWHREVYSIWSDRLKKYKPAWYTGSETPAQKEKEIQRFITDPDCKVLLMSLRSGSGVNGLQDVCSRVVIGELDWSHSAIEQCIGRVHRDGQTLPVFAYYLTSTEGADPIMIDVLGVKRAQLEGVTKPDTELLEKVQTDPEHVKKLATAYLEARRR